MLHSWPMISLALCVLFRYNWKCVNLRIIRSHLTDKAFGARELTAGAGHSSTLSHTWPLLRGAPLPSPASGVRTHLGEEQNLGFPLEDGLSSLPPAGAGAEIPWGLGRSCLLCPKAKMEA